MLDKKIVHSIKIVFSLHENEIMECSTQLQVYPFEAKTMMKIIEIGGLLRFSQP